MSRKQTRRLFIVAFALSLLVHLIAVQFVRWPFHRSSDDLQIVSIVHVPAVRISHIATPPPSTPSPAPTNAPRPNPVHHRISANGIHAVATSAPPATPAPPSSSPSPRASATPNCASADTPVAVAASPPPPDIPAGARSSTTGGTARVNVAVNADGTIASTALAQTSGDPQLDAIAVSMARDARYTPATHACKPIPSTYAYAVKFVAW